MSGLQKRENARGEWAESLFQSLSDLPSAKRFTGEQLEVIYSLAYAHVTQKQYQQALPIFAFLAQYGPTRKHYWTGMGLCLSMTGRFEEAESIYRLCALLFPEAPESMLHVAECQLARRQFDEVKQTLDEMIAQYGDDAAHEPVLNRAKALIKLSMSKAAA